MLVSLIRTWAPIWAGAVISYLIGLGVGLDTETQAAFVVAFTGLVQSVYYLVARWAEQRVPWLGAILLGSSSQPTYTP